ncbi:MAG: hypothetical protein Q8914_04370 [Bacteroidota bacterium]|nr:hypothetical protein [Bacteroidota bacterium]
MALFTGLLVSFGLNAQVEKEIRNFGDSTEFLVRNGKHFLIDRLNANDRVKAAETAGFLYGLDQTKHYRAFEYTEDLFLSLLLNNWQRVDSLARNIMKYEQPAYYGGRLSISAILNRLCIIQAPTLDLSVQASDATVAVKDLVHLLICLFESNQENDKSWEEALKAFKKKYPDGDYKDFINHYLPKPPVQVSFSTCGGVGFPALTSQMATLFSADPGLVIGFDVSGKKLYTSFNMQVGGLSARKPFTVNTAKGNRDFQTGDRSVLFNIGFSAGYYLMHSSRFRLLTYGNIGYDNIETSLSADDISHGKKDVELVGCFAPSFGLASEVKLADLKNYSQVPGLSSGYIGLKVDGNLNFPGKVPEGMDGQWLFAKVSLVWGLGKF